MKYLIIRALKRKARKRHPGKKIETLNGKTWKQCYVYEAGRHMLHYRLVGNKSSCMVYHKDVQMMEEIDNG